MKRLLLIGACAAFVATAAWADTLEAMRANTVTTQSGHTPPTRWLFNADGTYQMTGANGATVTGVYTSDAEKFCVTPASAERVCLAAIPQNKGPGDSWPVTDPEGNIVTVSIVPGR